MVFFPSFRGDQREIVLGYLLIVSILNRIRSLGNPETDIFKYLPHASNWKQTDVEREKVYTATPVTSLT